MEPKIYFWGSLCNHCWARITLSNTCDTRNWTWNHHSIYSYRDSDIPSLQINSTQEWRICIPVMSTSRDVARFFLFLPALCGKEYYSYPHRAGRNRKYIGIPVPLTKNRMLYHQSKLGQEQVFRGTSRGNPVPARCWMICYPDNWLCLMRGQRGLSWWWGGEKSSKSIFSWAGTTVTVMFQDCDAVIAWSEQKASSGAETVHMFHSGLGT